MAPIRRAVTQLTANVTSDVSHRQTNNPVMPPAA